MKTKKNHFLQLGLAAMSLLAVECLTTSCGEGTDGNVIVPNTYDYLSSNGMTNEPESVGNRFDDQPENPFVKTTDEPVSTFSVDADGASYAIMRRYLTEDLNVNTSSVRIEEFLNYFTFNYAPPTGDEHVAISAEVGDCPWNTEHKLLQLGIKGKELAADETPRANYVFLIDVSGSMSGRDRLELLKKGLTEMLCQLNPDDRISLITYSGEVKKLLESTPVRMADKIKKAISVLTASGSTAGGEALKMAYEEALANYDSKFNNRVIMGTDGDFNVGVTSTEELVEMVENYARQGIYMTCLGFGFGNLNDAMMEKISNAGNGTYHYIDCEDEMMKAFVHERSQFVSVANDAKCQVNFNPEVVSAYRLIGYENRVISNDDFENDKKDAGEIGAGQTITALYEIALNEDAQHDGIDPSQQLVTFDFRYKKTLDGASIPLKVTLTADRPFNKNARPNEFYFAAGVAAYGLILRESHYKGNATIGMAKELVRQGLSFDPHGHRAALLKLMDKVSESE